MLPKKRLYYFDMLKGLAIFIVVMGHVLTMCIREIDRAVLFKIIGQIHMPVFFFISGWFSFKQTSEGNDFRMPDLLQRFCQLVVPGVVVGMIWMIYFPHSGLQSPFDMSFRGLWLSDFKNGYWFTLTLFLIIVLYGAWGIVLRRFPTLASRAFGTFLLWTLMVAADSMFSTTDIWRLLSLHLVVAFFPVFMAGVLARTAGGRFTCFCSNPRVYTVALVASGFLTYFLVYPWEFPAVDRLVFDFAQPLLHFSFAVVGIALVKPWSERAFAPQAPATLRQFAGIWAFLGRKSLAIYLLHYFFLFPMPFFQEPLRAMGLDLVPTFVVAFAVAVLVVAMTLLVIAILERSRLLAWLLTGALK